jgi:hypothetical protein
MIWFQKPLPPEPAASPGCHVGLDLNASRAAATAASHGHAHTLKLDEHADELALAIGLESSTPVLGRAALALSRKLPHLVCSNFLPALGTAREWKAGRYAFTPASAIRLAFDKFRTALHGEHDLLALSLPVYLTSPQVETVIDTAHRAGLPLEGTISTPLAIVADRVHEVLAVETEESDEPVVMPLRPAKPGTGSVLVIDADAHALSATLIAIEPRRIHRIGVSTWPRAGLKAWTERLLDVLADRCVRLCRRDPRDSADAEQTLFEQLDPALDRLRIGQKTKLTIRTAQWFQDLVLQPEDFERACTGLIKPVVDGVKQLVASASLTTPPRAVWLTHAAGRLPGLMPAIHQHSAECTNVTVLPPTAASHAAAHLVARWHRGELPHTHVDSELEIGAKDEESSRDSKETNPPQRPSSRTSSGG